MCTTCGVTEQQYNVSRVVARLCCMVSLCEREGINPATYGYMRPSAEAISSANDRIQHYHAAHPGCGLTREEMLTELAERGWNREGPANEHRE